ncbi:MAG: mechanosensitive ion channel domain-containing protein [Verrucomicrobiota bacterium JB025]
MHWALIARKPDLGNEGKFARQLVMLGVTVVVVLAIVLVLPVSDSSRNKLLGLIGIIFSGILAFSSTSIFGNLAAGILLRITKPFRSGDFIEVGPHFGRVSERGLFETEIQTEMRELVALPNIYCISNPVKTIRGSGTIISVSLSLGYDVHHTRIEELLLEAAREAGLEDGFVHILELGNFAVTYRVSGFLAEPKFLISSRSRLYGSVLDTLHAKGIEIMSPSFMNQRKLEEDFRALPAGAPVPKAGRPLERSIEDLAFDKAERAGELELEKQQLTEEIQEAEKARKEAVDDAGKQELEGRIERAQERLKEIAKATEDNKLADGASESGGASNGDKASG